MQVTFLLLSVFFPRNESKNSESDGAAHQPHLQNAAAEIASADLAIRADTVQNRRKNTSTTT